MGETLLHQTLLSVRRRLLAVGIIAGAGWALAMALLLLILFAWVDLALDLPAPVRALCGWSALILGSAVLLRALATTIAGGTATVIARRLDRVAGTGGQVLTGVDLLRQYGPVATAGAGVAEVSRGLAYIAIERASAIATQVRAATAIPSKPIAQSYSAVAAIGVLIATIAIVSPRVVATQWVRFIDPYGDHPPYSSVELRVEPGDTKVLYGGSLDVHAIAGGAAHGNAVEHPELVFKSDSANAEESVPMFPEADGTWRGAVSDLTTSGSYFVRARGIRTRRYHYDLITVPELRAVRFRVSPPAYTHLPPFDGPLPQGGLAGLAGTRVEFWAKSNRPLSGGKLDFAADVTAATQPMTVDALTTAVKAVSTGAAEVTGSFKIDRPGKMKLTVIDIDGQSSRDPFVAPVTVLTDARPFVRITEPRPESFATPDVTLNVQIAAEDDYGISRLQLFRALNDSRVLPTAIPIPPDQPTRFNASVPLNLADYGLEPGDVVKLYARVEDNDPAGAKGTETPVVLVHVISKEDFDRMVLAREGLEVLEAKYAQAMRRLEALDNLLAAEQEELKELPPDGALAEAKRNAIEKLAGEMDRAAAAVEEAGHQDLPFDIDKKFREQLSKVAQDMHQAAEETRRASRGQGLSNAQAEESLQKARQRLGARREDFAREAADPLDRLANLFPLIEDETRFVDLWRRQSDLAERMKSLEQAAGDDPVAKSRMRDLQGEQQKLREELRDLLVDVENHAAALRLDDRPQGGKPGEEEKSKLEELRKSALDFVRAARQSGASEQMAESEQKLEDFAGGPAAVKAREAAASLEALIARCNSIGEQGIAQMRFQPKLAQGLGNTVDQLLEAEGLGSGAGKGKGSGAGFSQRRSSLHNVGLYGRRPTGRPGGPAGGGRRGGQGTASPGNGHGADLTGGTIDSQRLQASGASEAVVPPQYKQKVGEYFQRIADELGDK